MKTRSIWIAAILLLPTPIVAQDPAVITMDQEPHHHLALHNDEVKVFAVQVAPGDSIVLHRHDQDTIAIAIGEQKVTVGIPGKADVHQVNADAQVRLQRSGYIHSTRVDGDTPYHTVAVELMRPQTNFHNLCVAVLPSEPLNCLPPPARTAPLYTTQPLLKSDQTQARLVSLLPRQSLDLSMNLEDAHASPDCPQLIVALDYASIAGSGNGGEKILQPGDFMWLEGGHGPARIFQNTGPKEARLIDIIFLHAR
jgi:uncharacterized Zn-binding protein involved in type VI secretion